MGHSQADVNARPDLDPLLQQIVEYVRDYQLCETRDRAVFDTARQTLLDALGCGFLGLRFPECLKVRSPANDPLARVQLDISQVDGTCRHTHHLFLLASHRCWARMSRGQLSRMDRGCPEQGTSSTQSRLLLTSDA